MKPIQPFKKVLRPGTARGYVVGDVFVKVEYDLTKEGDAEKRKPRLSLTGVVGPYRSGNAKGGCGQIAPVDIEHLAPGWTPAMLEKLWGAWKRWHLNDMRAGCEHQRAAGWGEKELQLVTLRLKTEVLARQNKIKDAAIESLKATGSALLADDERRVLNLGWEVVASGDDPVALKVYGSEYDVKKREKKLACWVKPEEHAEGVLGKPCPECGYKHGTAWLCEEVPAEVLEFLKGLPDADEPCPWHNL